MPRSSKMQRCSPLYILCKHVSTGFNQKDHALKIPVEREKFVQDRALYQALILVLRYYFMPMNLSSINFNCLNCNQQEFHLRQIRYQNASNDELKIVQGIPSEWEYTLFHMPAIVVYNLLLTFCSTAFAILS